MDYIHQLLINITYKGPRISQNPFKLNPFYTLAFEGFFHLYETKSNHFETRFKRTTVKRIHRRDVLHRSRAFGIGNR